VFNLNSLLLQKKIVEILYMVSAQCCTYYNLCNNYSSKIIIIYHLNDIDNLLIECYNLMII
jgi:hypothetical protein